jgi:hypothetical protein
LHLLSAFLIRITTSNALARQAVARHRLRAPSRFHSIEPLQQLLFAQLVEWLVDSRARSRDGVLREETVGSEDEERCRRRRLGRLALGVH